MQDMTRKHLGEILSQYGQDLIHDHRRTEALLRDVCGAYKREINVLIAAQREGIAEDLLRATPSNAPEFLVARLARRVEQNLGFGKTVAIWAVESWALVLGVIATPLEKAWREIIQEYEGPESDEGKVFVVSEEDEIQAALESVQTGDTVLIRSGSYVVQVHFHGLANIRIVGEGTEPVEVTGTLILENCTDFQVEAIAFRHAATKSEPRSVIEARSSRNIRIVSCVASGSSAHAGIEVVNGSQVVIQRSRCSHNRIGIYVHSRSSVEVSNSVCEENRQHGIWAQGPRTSLTLKSNHCDRNGEVGILYTGEADGTLERNHCESNGYHGIAIAKNSKIEPLLRDNLCRNHPGAGISWSWETH